jgi:hypothetical protein
VSPCVFREGTSTTDVPARYPYGLGREEELRMSSGNVYLPTGTKVRNLKPNVAPPVGTLGTVMDGPGTTYGVTVQWEGFEYFDTYGERGWRPYWSTDELERV